MLNKFIERRATIGFSPLNDFPGIGVAEVNNQGIFKSANQGLADLLGVSLKSIPQTSILDFVAEKEQLKIQQSLSNKRKIKLDVILINFFGSELYAQVLFIPSASETVHLVFIDQTDLMLRLSKVTHDSYHDFLTGLGNRRYFEQCFNKCFEDAEQEVSFNMLALDLDKFKHVNDTYGHEAGNQVLIWVANKLKSAEFHSKMHGFRVGGDEFILLSHPNSFHSPDSFYQLAESLLNQLCRSVDFGDFTAEVALSAGLLQFSGPSSLYQINNNTRINHGKVAGLKAKLLTSLDNALYESKRHSNKRISSVSYVSKLEESLSTQSA